MIKKSFETRIYESNPRNDNLNDFTFYGDERLITRRQLYFINYNIIFRLNNVLSVYV